MILVVQGKSGIKMARAIFLSGSLLLSGCVTHTKFIYKDDPIADGRRAVVLTKKIKKPLPRTKEFWKGWKDPFNDAESPVEYIFLGPVMVVVWVVGVIVTPII